MQQSSAHEQWEKTLSLEAILKDFEACSSWLDKDVSILKQKHPSFQTFIVQGELLQELFKRSREAMDILRVSNVQVHDFVHLLEAVVWLFHLNVCALISEKSTNNSEQSKIFNKISNNLFGNLIFLRDHLVVILNDEFKGFNKNYSNLAIYTLTENFMLFFRLYCSWFETELQPVKPNKKAWCLTLVFSARWPFINFRSHREEGKRKDYTMLSGWEKIGAFLKTLRNESEHRYNKRSKKDATHLKEFDVSLIIDYLDQPGYQPKLGNKIRKYPVAVLLLLRFILKDQDTTFEEVNKDWFSLGNKMINCSGSVEKWSGV